MKRRLDLLPLALISLPLWCMGCATPTTTSATNSVQLPSWAVTTIAGNGTAAYKDGSGSDVAFGGLSGIAVDLDGNLYVSDFNRIRKVTPSGTASTLAGNDTPGFKDDDGTKAEFSGPAGLTVDGQGTVYVADPSNNRIRKITASGTVTTFGGNGTPGFADGSGSTVQFNSPMGVALDAVGNLIVADSLNNRIRKIAADGSVTTFAGTGVAGFRDGSTDYAQFTNPQAVTTDSSGTVYVADNGRIRRIAAGVVSTLAGYGLSGYVDGDGKTAKFYSVQGLATDGKGNVYVADAYNNRVRLITAGGIVSTFAGSGVPGTTSFADGLASEAVFAWPVGVTLNSAGDVIVADGNNHRLRRIAKN